MNKFIKEIASRSPGRYGGRMALPFVLGVSALMWSCASIGNPSGGPRDEDPPRFVRANPAPGSTNVNPEKITITFDELINVKDAYSTVVMSPVGASVPRVSSSGRSVTVNIQDTLLPNTTYTIDFANSIEDNNEGNKLQGFTYTFSTGPDIDTLTVSGMVLSAKELEPQQGVLVGLHSDLVDTAFTRTKLERIAKTDDRGRFIIRGLKSQPYRIFMLKDMDNDYKYANPEEDIAFGTEIITPWAEQETTTDTIWNLKTGAVDTVVSRVRTRFLPNDVLLRSFNVDRKSQYLVKYERVDSTRLSLIFNSKAAAPPLISLIGKDSIQSQLVREGSLTNDTIIYWMRDMGTVRDDSLRVALNYLRTDTAGQLSPYLDTLNFITNRPKPKKQKEKKKKKDDVVAKISAEDSIKAITLGFKVTSPTTQEMYDRLTLEFDTPLERLDSSAFHLQVMIDSVFKPVPKPALLSMRDSLSPRIFTIEYPWEFGAEYRLVVDTLAATGIYGKPTRPLEHKFKIKAEDEYCSLTLNVTNFTDGPAFVELLSGSDEVVRRVPVEDGQAFLPFLAPGKYYVRIVEDHNGNGEFDTGDFDKGLQPDLAYYYPKAINIKKNWDKEETWDVFATAIDLMKPETLKKNKPEASKADRFKKKQEEEEEEDELFDPNANPFDPNDKRRRQQNQNRLR